MPYDRLGSMGIMRYVGGSVFFLPLFNSRVGVMTLFLLHKFNTIYLTFLYQTVIIYLIFFRKFSPPLFRANYYCLTVIIWTKVYRSPQPHCLICELLLSDCNYLTDLFRNAYPLLFSRFPTAKL